MSKLGHPVVYTAHEGHHVTETHPVTGAIIEGSLHHPHLRQFAGLIGRIHQDGRCDIFVFVPNKPGFWADAIEPGFGPNQFHLFHHEAEEMGEDDPKPGVTGDTLVGDKPEPATAA